MKELTYEEILRMVTNACFHVLHSRDEIDDTIVKSATEIYIAQMNNQTK